MHHDYNYKLADEGKMTRHEADKVMLDELNTLENKKLSWNEWFAKYFTKVIIGTKYKLGLGIDGDLMAEEMHRPIRHKFKRRRVFVYTVDDIWSADLMDRHNIAKNNKGYKYILTVIDIFSKFAYAIPLKNKSSESIIEAFKSYLLVPSQENYGLIKELSLQIIDFKTSYNKIILDYIMFTMKVRHVLLKD